MAKYLVIVESPNKTATIKKYLGNDFDVIGTAGHFRDLPDKEIGVDIKNDFSPSYEIDSEKKTLIDSIIAKAKKADLVYLATDLDREGEYISFHLSQVLPCGTKFKRIRYQAINKADLEKAIKDAGEINHDLVNAAECRRILDRLCGYKVSYTVKQATGGVSAGRVQSATLRFLAEREKEIQTFVPVTYWDIEAELITKKFEKVLAKLTKPEKLEVNTKELSDKICDTIKKGPVKVSLYEKITAMEKPYAPFTTSSLQQAASSFLGWSPDKTMKVAQDLFAAGSITYHRTDSTFIAADFINAMKSQIVSDYGNEYLPKSNWFYSKGKNTQEAHEACRPTDISKKCAGSGDGDALYKMIWRRTVASQMEQSKYSRTKAEFKAKEYVLTTTGSKCIFDGWRKCWNYGTLDNSEVPEMKSGDEMNVLGVTSTEEQTKPPSRYTEASCVKQMEKLGIGRPATYAATLKTLKDRSYVNKAKNSLQVTDLGIKVTDFLVNSKFCFVDLQFTANLEEDLDRVANNEKGKLCVLTEFYNRLKEDLGNSKAIKAEAQKTGFKCPKCKGSLLKKNSKWGAFFSCEFYKHKDTPCDYTAKVGSDGKPEEKVKKDPPKSSDKECPKCGKVMYIRKSQYGEFLGCSGYPNCKTIMDMDGNVKESKKKPFKKWGKKKKDSSGDEE